MPSSEERQKEIIEQMLASTPMMQFAKAQQQKRDTMAQNTPLINAVFHNPVGRYEAFKDPSLVEEVRKNVLNKFTNALLEHEKSVFDELGEDSVSYLPWYPDFVLNGGNR